MASKYTPGPWSVRKSYKPAKHQDANEIIDADGEVVAAATCSGTEAQRAHCLTRIEKAVRAVNAYDALVEALDQLVTAGEFILADEGVTSLGTINTDCLGKRIVAARTALAKAEGNG